MKFPKEDKESFNNYINNIHNIHNKRLKKKHINEDIKKLVVLQIPELDK